MPRGACGHIRELADRTIASIAAFAAQRQRRSCGAFALELRCVAREVDDARALTRSPDLSDALGRIQFQLRRLAKDLDCGAQNEPGKDAVPRMNAIVRVEASGGALDAIDDGAAFETAGRPLLNFSAIVKKVRR